ncbi:MAG: hypothetical protein KME28_23930 [Pelatocladus maniniholoensis HA4357-MV3]|uniref:Uncharacterized protein n=1 Tax=Pelatocladus maniniholoensis HA4357-MV3 TaxID=1117104 RepID=A0A9E3HCJ9_9NOST|nr:hypothetical protein [Pelatocladus maniniholoensis HA4357-MV3]BAZ70218.1 hypothetical protein NIES4106_50050 [Fischerella sp. NIES-4106]
MLEHINKFLPPRQYRLPLIGLLLILGVVGERSKPVLSNQLARLHMPTSQEFDNQTATYNWLQRKPSASLKSTSTDKEIRLRRALVGSSSTPNQLDVEDKTAPTQLLENPAQTYTWLQGNNTPSSEASTSLSSKIAVADKTKNLQESASKASTKTTQVSSKSKFPRQDGVYLYGQSPKPGQLGQGYIVFEKRQNKIIGALYMPSSEYSCFNGTLNSSGELAMTVRGYVGEMSPSEIATSSGLPQRSDEEPDIYGHSVELQDYYQLNSITGSDRQILKTCKTN